MSNQKADGTSPNSHVLCKGSQAGVILEQPELFLVGTWLQPTPNESKLSERLYLRRRQDTQGILLLAAKPYL